MPGGDGTGPRGQGSRTGRGLGNCPPSSGAGRTSFGLGGGFGRGQGRGLGFRRVGPQDNQVTNQDTTKNDEQK